MAQGSGCTRSSAIGFFAKCVRPPPGRGRSPECHALTHALAQRASARGTPPPECAGTVEQSIEQSSPALSADPPDAARGAAVPSCGTTKAPPRRHLPHAGLPLARGRSDGRRISRVRSSRTPGHWATRRDRLFCRVQAAAPPPPRAREGVARRPSPGRGEPARASARRLRRNCWAVALLKRESGSGGNRGGGGGGNRHHRRRSSNGALPSTASRARGLSTNHTSNTFAALCI